MMDKIDLMFVIILIVAVGAIGWFGNDVYNDITAKRYLDGLFISGANGDLAREISEDSDKFGDWVCINTNGMNFEEIVRTCQHEAAHEVFAEIIEDSPEKVGIVLGVIEE